MFHHYPYIAVPAFVVGARNLQSTRRWLEKYGFGWFCPSVQFIVQIPEYPLYVIRCLTTQFHLCRLGWVDEVFTTIVQAGDVRPCLVFVSEHPFAGRIVGGR